MPKIPWIDFAKVYPHAHLVVGLMGDATGAPVREACNVLSKLAARHEDGDFAVGIRRDSGATAVFCALADPTAAGRLADALGARPIDDVAGSSYRTFDVDEEVLGHLRERVKRAPPTSHKFGRLLRRPP
jgi:hypothetical protein